MTLITDDILKRMADGLDDSTARHHACHGTPLLRVRRKRRLCDLPAVLVDACIVRALLLAYRPVRCEAKPCWTFEGGPDAWPGYAYDPARGAQ